MIDMQKVKQLLAVISIEEIAQRLGLLSTMRQTYNGYNGRCPFCGATEEKFYIYPNHGKHKPGWYKCYRGSCNAHGDALQLIRELEDVNFGQAVARLASYAGVNLGHLQIHHYYSNNKST